MTGGGNVALGLKKYFREMMDGALFPRSVMRLLKY